MLSYGEWVKVRDVTGDLAWVEAKALDARRHVIVNVAGAKVRSAADEGSQRDIHRRQGRAAGTGRADVIRLAQGAAPRRSGRLHPRSRHLGRSESPQDHERHATSRSWAPAPGAPPSRWRWPRATTCCCGAAMPTPWRRWRRARENTPYLPGFPAAGPTGDRQRPSTQRHRIMWRGPRSAAADRRLPGGRPAALLAAAIAAVVIPNLVWLCKGFEDGIAPAAAPGACARCWATACPARRCPGPSFAQEVARGLPCALTVASADAALRERVVAALHGGNMRVYSTRRPGRRGSGRRGQEHAGDRHRRRRRPGPGLECARRADHARPGRDHPAGHGAGRTARKPSWA